MTSSIYKWFLKWLNTWNNTHEMIGAQNRSNRLEVLCRKGALRGFAKFTGKHLCQSFSFNKVTGNFIKCFPVNFAKFLRTHFFTEHQWLLLSNHKVLNLMGHFQINLRLITYT